MMAFKEWWQNLPADKQLQIKRTSLIAGAIVLSLGVYYGSGRDKIDNAVPPPEKRALSLGSKNLLEEDISAKVAKDLSSVTESVNAVSENVNTMEQRLNGYDELLKSIKSEKDHLADPKPASESNTKDVVSADSLNKGSQKLPSGVHYPEPPPPTQFASGKLLEAEAQKIQPRLIGSIGRTQGEKVTPPQAKKKNTIYMPPSFMPAMLLTGLHALTSQAGKGNPEPVLIRVQAPAQLPNSLKSNLRGCFVIANATGNLAQERVDLQLVSLTCMALDESAVIDQEIQGFVADKDGVRGLSGNVVTKAGAHVSRMFLAGVFGGLGQSVTNSSTTVSSSPLGATQTIDPHKSLQAGLGQGIKTGSTAIQDLFLEYAKQSSPVIEVGTAKQITVVIQKGVDLKILEKA